MDYKTSLSKYMEYLKARENFKEKADCSSCRNQNDNKLQIHKIKIYELVINSTFLLSRVGKKNFKSSI